VDVTQNVWPIGWIGVLGYIDQALTIAQHVGMNAALWFVLGAMVRQPYRRNRMLTITQGERTLTVPTLTTKTEIMHGNVFHIVDMPTVSPADSALIDAFVRGLEFMHPGFIVECVQYGFLEGGATESDIEVKNGEDVFWNLSDMHGDNHA
jgi:hypothetical protein